MSSSHAVHESHHPTFKQYVYVALILFAITAVEFLIIVPDNFRGKGWTIAPLAGLSVIKFGIVIFYYMHLKFDNKLLTWIFLSGLGLGVCVVFALVTLFLSYTPSPREYAQIHAVPFSHEAEGAERSAEPEPAQEPTQPDGAAPEPSGSEPAAAPAARAADGEAVFFGSGGCVACHTIDGTAAAGTLGPNLTQVGAKDEAYIRESIENPTAVVVEGFPPIMPAGLKDKMTDAQFEGLVLFLLNQK